MIDSRIKISTRRGAPNYDEAVMAEILAGARAASVAGGKLVVRVEVEHPGEIWDKSGDALEIDLSADPVTFTTLPPYGEVAP